jgi:ATP-dependent protease ClpP protease subunit
MEIREPMWGEHKLPDPAMLLIYKGFEDRDIWLDTEIDFEDCNVIIKYIQYLNRREADDKTPIKLHIVSPGGELSVMFTLYHTIKNSIIPVHTINEGGAHSAAFIVFLAGHVRTMLPDATFVCHNGSGVIGGSFKETKEAMAQYNTDIEKMNAIIIKETFITKKLLEEKLDRNSDWYIGREEAEERGILTEKSGIVYEIINKQDNKKYIGETTQVPQKEWADIQEAVSDASVVENGLNTPFFKDVYRLGGENFTFNVISRHPLSELSEQKNKIIERENSIAPNGYN